MTAAMRLRDKVALITGAARGQGEAEARLFAAEGARVVLGDVLDEDGQKVASEIGDAAHYVHLDVSRPEDWERAVGETVSRFGKLDVLINNAGILRSGGIEETSLDDYLAVIHVNQVGTFLGIKTAAPALRAAGGGSIVNLSSIAGLQGVGGLVSYVSSKWAVRGMTKVAALELGHSGIRVNSIHPGGIDTEMVRQQIRRGPDVDAVHRSLPIPRIGTSEEVARLALFLASDESSYCTGSEFTIDGGLTAGTAAAVRD